VDGIPAMCHGRVNVAGGVKDGNSNQDTEKRQADDPSKT